MSAKSTSALFSSLREQKIPRLNPLTATNLSKLLSILHSAAAIGVKKPNLLLLLAISQLWHTTQLGLSVVLGLVDSPVLDLVGLAGQPPQQTGPLVLLAVKPLTPPICNLDQLAVLVQWLAI